MKPGFLIFLFIFFCCSQNKKTEQLENLKKNNSTKTNNTENIALLIDVSVTMMSPDFEPTRIKSVVEELRNIVNDKNANHYFSIVVFSGNSYVHCPLTSDKAKLLTALKGIEIYWEKLRPGTNIPEALLNAAYSLKKAESNKSILIFSDGPTNVETYPISLASDILLRERIRLNTIIISPKEYELLPIKMDDNGELIFEKTKVKPIDRRLIDISTQTNGLHKVFNSSKEIHDFNFSDFIGKSMKQHLETSSATVDSSTVSKIYLEMKNNNNTFKINTKN